MALTSDKWFTDNSLSDQNPGKLGQRAWWQGLKKWNIPLWRWTNNLTPCYPCVCYVRLPLYVPDHINSLFYTVIILIAYRQTRVLQVDDQIVTTHGEIPLQDKCYLVLWAHQLPWHYSYLPVWRLPPFNMPSHMTTTTTFLFNSVDKSRKVIFAK